MMTRRLSSWTATLPVLLAVVVVIGTAVAVNNLFGSDHVDAVEVELNPTIDLNDVYAFPGATADRIALVMTVASPTNALGRNVTRFNPHALYQFKIDNTGDAVEDLVIQVIFNDMTDGTQRVNVLGPAAPVETGRVNRLIDGPVSTGTLDAEFTDNDIRIFAGTRSDPFFIDFEQFVRIIPDRRPATFLNDIGPDPEASAFRPPPSECTDGEVTGDPGPFDPNHGCAVNIFQGANGLAIVLEMPVAMLTGGGDGTIGVWATIGL